MKYPKAIMTIQELREMGFPRRDLEAYTREKDFPAHKTAGGRRWLVHTDELDEFIENYNRRVALKREIIGARKAV